MLATVLSLVGCSTPIADAVTTKAAAINRAKAVLRALHKPFFDASPTTRFESAAKRWDVEFESDQLQVSIQASDGVCVAFIDMAGTDAAWQSVLAGPAKRVVKTRDQAIGLANQFLKAAGVSQFGFVPQEVKWMGQRNSGPGHSSQELPYVIVEYAQRAKGFAGHINNAIVTLDYSNRQLMTARCSTHLKFSRPKTVMSRTDAARRLRDLFQSEKRWRTKAQNQWSSPYYWPGDNEVAKVLRLSLTSSGNDCFGSTYGTQLVRAHRVRAAWIYDNRRISVAIDAENGQPMWCGVKK